MHLKDQIYGQATEQQAQSLFQLLTTPETRQTTEQQTRGQLVSALQQQLNNANAKIRPGMTEQDRNAVIDATWDVATAINVLEGTN